jgi:hypothetical protein
MDFQWMVHSLVGAGSQTLCLPCLLACLLAFIVIFGFVVVVVA